MTSPSSPTPVPATTARDPEIAIIKVRDNVDGMTGWAWPIVERVPGGWQSGAHHYPDADVLSVRLLAVSSPPAGDTTTEVHSEYRVTVTRPDGQSIVFDAQDFQAQFWREHRGTDGYPPAVVESRTVWTTRTELPWEEEQ